MNVTIERIIRLRAEHLRTERTDYFSTVTIICNELKEACNGKKNALTEVGVCCAVDAGALFMGLLKEILGLVNRGLDFLKEKSSEDARIRGEVERIVSDVYESAVGG